MSIFPEKRHASADTVPTSTSKKLSRRRLIKTSAVIGAGYWIGSDLQAAEDAKTPGPNDQIRVASIGIGGKGRSDSKAAAKFGKIVAICDIDSKRLEAMKKDPDYKDAAAYTDFRKMFDEMADKIDAVTVSTPDHNHAAASLMAMRLGKHVYCQKPLTRTVYESHLMGKVANEMGVATQMGNQGAAGDRERLEAALLKSGALGKVSEIHLWTNRPIWPQGLSRKLPTCPCPEHVDWENWIGSGKFRPYAKGFHPFAWRGYWDYGSGALGDMGCHRMSMVFKGLDLSNPISVVAETSGHDREMLPAWSKVTYEFGATEKQGPIKLFWYDGGQLPDVERFPQIGKDTNGCLVVGEKATLLAGKPLPPELEKVEVDFEKAPQRDLRNGQERHTKDWFNAIQSGKPAYCDFASHAAPLTKTVLLGNLAVWVANQAGAPGTKIEWDAKALKANLPDLENLIKPTYRKGWKLDA